jgi:hypothetical protein
MRRNIITGLLLLSSSVIIYPMLSLWVSYPIMNPLATQFLIKRDEEIVHRFTINSSGTYRLECKAIDINQKVEGTTQYSITILRGNTSILSNDFYLYQEKNELVAYPYSFHLSDSGQYLVKVKRLADTNTDSSEALVTQINLRLHPAILVDRMFISTLVIFLLCPPCILLGLLHLLNAISIKRRSKATLQEGIDEAIS